MWLFGSFQKVYWSNCWPQESLSSQRSVTSSSEEVGWMATVLSKSAFVAPIFTATANPCSISSHPIPCMWIPTTWETKEKDTYYWETSKTLQLWWHSLPGPVWSCLNIPPQPSLRLLASLALLRSWVLTVLPSLHKLFTLSGHLSLPLFRVKAHLLFRELHTPPLASFNDHVVSHYQYCSTMVISQPQCFTSLFGGQRVAVRLSHQTWISRWRGRCLLLPPTLPLWPRAAKALQRQPACPCWMTARRTVKGHLFQLPSPSGFSLHFQAMGSCSPSANTFRVTSPLKNKVREHTIQPQK